MLKKILILLCLNIGIFNLSNASSELPVLSGVGGNFSAVDMHNNPMQMNDYRARWLYSDLAILIVRIFAPLL